MAAVPGWADDAKRGLAVVFTRHAEMPEIPESRSAAMIQVIDMEGLNLPQKGTKHAKMRKSMELAKYGGQKNEFFPACSWHRGSVGKYDSADGDGK